MLHCYEKILCNLGASLCTNYVYDYVQIVQCKYYTNCHTMVHIFIYFCREIMRKREKRYRRNMKRGHEMTNKET